MDTRHLRGFLKIAETRSISRAAESLGIAQPSLSQQLLRLEDEVGLSLFRRTPKGVDLTEGGRVFLEHARQIMNATEQAIEDVRDLTMDVSGEVVLAVPYSISKVAGVALVEAFLKHAPQVSLRLVEAFTGQIRGWLDLGKVDLGILHDMGHVRHLSARRLASEELFLIGPPGELGTADEPLVVNPSDLSGFPMLLPGPQHGLRQVVEQEVTNLGGAIAVRVELDAMSHLGELVGRGHGYSITPMTVVNDDLATGRVSIGRSGQGGISRRLSLMRNATRVVTHASVRCEDLTAKVLLGMIAKGLWPANAEA
jgi:LysR family transcriptional regulator, nitrogen assimilation regulatory protein